MNIITRNDVLASSNNVAWNGLVLIRSYNLQNNKSGTGTFISGTAEGLGSIAFKVWDNLNAYEILQKNNLQNKVCKIQATTNVFNNTIYLIISDIEEYTGDEVTALDFYTLKYDEQKLWDSMLKVMQENCSKEAQEVYVTVLKPYQEKFRKEFAAISHHDACVNGLLAHTSRVVKLAQILRWYPKLLDTVTSDAVFLGCALHDIGKVLEYNYGTRSEQGKVLNHLSLGVSMLMEHKSLICDKLGYKFYETMLSVVQQHHGEYGERPKTIAAYIVHKLDQMDTKFIDLTEAIENRGVSDVVFVDEFMLHVPTKEAAE